MPPRLPRKATAHTRPKKTVSRSYYNIYDSRKGRSNFVVWGGGGRNPAGHTRDYHFHTDPQCLYENVEGAHSKQIAAVIGGTRRRRSLARLHGRKLPPSCSDGSASGAL